MSDAKDNKNQPQDSPATADEGLDHAEPELNQPKQDDAETDEAKGEAPTPNDEVEATAAAAVEPAPCDSSAEPVNGSPSQARASRGPDRRVRASLVGIGVDVTLIVLKLSLAYFTASIALQADALHSSSDLAVSLTVLTMMLLRQRATRTQSPRLRRWVRWLEPALAIILAIGIAVAGVTIFFELSNPSGSPHPDRLWLGVVGAGLAAVIAYFISAYKIAVGRAEAAPALIADGYHSRMDMFSSIGVAMALLGQWIGVPVDSLAALVIAVLIFSTSAEALLMAIRSLRGDTTRATFLPRLLGRQLDRGLRALTRRTGRERGLADWRQCIPRFLDLRRRGPRFGLALTLIIGYGLSGLTVVDAHQVGARLRFGRVIGDNLQPGLHFALPWPIEEIRRFEKDRVRRVEVGFRVDQEATSNSPGVWDTSHERAGYSKIAEEAISITADEYLVDLSMVVHIRTDDPVQANLRVADLEEVVRGAAEARLRTIVAKHRLGELLTTGRDDLLEHLHKELAADLQAYDLGVSLVAVYLHDIHPPVEVVKAFRRVFSAQEDRHQAVSKAKAFRNESLPKARADANTQRVEASAQANDLVVRASGEAERFQQVASAYQSAPQVSYLLLYLDTLEKILPEASKIIAAGKVNRGAYQRSLFLPSTQAKDEAKLPATR